MRNIIYEFYNHTQFAYLGSLSLVVQSAPFILIVGLIYWLIRRFSQKKRFGVRFSEMRKRCRLNELIRLCFLIWALETVAVVIMPFGFWESVWRVLAGIDGSVNINTSGFSFEFSYVPVWFYAVPSGRILFMLAANIALYVPFGLFLSILKRKPSFLKTVLAGFLCSLAAELIQPLLYGRSGDIDDLICNTLGAAVGYLIYLAIKKLFPGFVEKCRTSAAW